MSDKSSSSAINGLGLFLFFITLLVLKLTNVIDWSWWWITAPLWGHTALFLIFFLIIIIVKRGK